MTRQLDEVIARVKALPDERQDEAAGVLLDFIEQQNAEIYLSPEQIAEVESRLSDREPYASAEEVQTFFKRFRT